MDEHCWDKNAGDIRRFFTLICAIGDSDQMVANVDTHQSKAVDTKTFLGVLMVGYAAQGPEAGEDEGPAAVSNTTLGVGTEADLIAWARALRTDEDIFPKNEVIVGVWIDILPTVGGRIPYELGDDLPDLILLIEGEVEEGWLAQYDEDVKVRRVPPPITH